MEGDAHSKNGYGVYMAHIEHATVGNPLDASITQVPVTGVGICPKV